MHQRTDVTRGDVVTLSGEVASSEEKSLAEELARNTGDVQDVRNQLVVRKQNVRKVRSYIESNPLITAGIAFAAGVLLSSLVRR